MDGIYCSQFVFYNDFDSANLSRVVPVFTNDSESLKQSSSSSTNKSTTGDIVDAEFNIWTKPDCYGTEFENGNRTWFYFGLKAPRPGMLVKLNLVDLNRQGKMYSQGMAPVCRIIPGRPKWERIQDKPVYGTNEDIFTLSFKFRTAENPESRTYFAFTYPFSYSELQKMLASITAKYLAIQPITEDDIYYVRETVCRSLEGRNVDLITITSYHGITMEREERLKHLFPDKDTQRPHKFVGKKVIFISARVHPGETPSSFVFNGILNMLLNRDDLQAQTLRKLYVFKLIPFLNPDGVARGHYRTDTKGANLNRVYLNPSLADHPTIYAARALIRYYHYGFEKDDVVPKCDSCRKHPDTIDNVNKMSHMSLNEEQTDNSGCGSLPWCTKCKNDIRKLESSMPGISDLVPTFRLDTNHPSSSSSPCSSGHNFCRQCGCMLTHTESKEEVKFETVAVGNYGDVNSNESGLFLYLDLHGHASKKGIFMYGNHFDDLERRVECMLLPKLMGLNNHNFHFQGCNFTERNMYLRDKRDGMSRAGSGRVAVLSLTGIIKSYTLECNYNTGRLVNVLPAAVKETSGKVHTLPVPPKYTPQIFEEVGRSIGASILDLTGQNPFSRLPNSEFHNLGGLRDWLRNSCCSNDFGGDARPKLTRMRNSRPSLPPHIGGGTHQGKTRIVPHLHHHHHHRSIVGGGNVARKPSSSTSVALKENLAGSCSKSTTSLKLKKTKSRSKDLKSRKSGGGAVGAVATALPQQQQQSTAAQLQQPTAQLQQQEEVAAATATSSDGTLRLREIRFIKNAEGKTLIAKYQNKGNEGEQEFEDDLVVSWDAPTSRPTVYTHKYRVRKMKAASEPGTSKQTEGGTFRVHNFAKPKFKKAALRRLASATDLTKIERKKKKKLRAK